MPRKAKLKVYRTPIGFHDAYVAAPSQKAALKAWGSDADLFARGVADVVTDPKLTAEPLGQPGQVIKRLRGSAAEQIAALPPSLKRARKKPASDAAKASRPAAKKPATGKTAAKPPPRPSRAPVEAADRAMRDAEARQRSETAALAREEAELDRRRARLRRRHAEETARLERALDRARAAYEAAMAEWRG